MVDDDDNNPGPPRTLKEYFRRTGNTQVWLADRVGLSKSYVSQLVSGKRNARGAIAERIHNATGVSVETLVVPERLRRRRKKRGLGGSSTPAARG